MRKRLSRSAVVPRNESEENTHAPNIMKQFISKTELIFLSASRLSSGCISIRPMRRRDEPSDLLNFFFSRSLSSARSLVREKEVED